MRRNSQMNLLDVNRELLHYISDEIVPQVYFYLGDAICHYLIDEFQDTAPMQWETVKPLFDEALSKRGSLLSSVIPSNRSTRSAMPIGAL